MRFLVALLTLLACACSLFARVAAVRTLDGSSHTGHVRLTRDGLVVVNAEENLVRVVPLTNVWRLTYSDDAPAESPEEETGFGVLPPGWKETTIGSTRVQGSTRSSQRGTFTVRGAGGHIGGNYDSCHYVYRAVEGDHDILARVSTVQLTHRDAKAGLMMRETIGAQGRHVTLALNAGGGGEFQVRAADGQLAQGAQQPFIRAGSWLRLRRRGQEFTAYQSANGRQWIPLQQIQLPIREQYYVGLAVASGNESVLNWTTFDHVRAGTRLPAAQFTPLVELTSGSSIPGRPVEIDQGQLLFAGALRPVKVPAAHVARIIYQPLTPELAWKSRASRPGVWLDGGDFFDGELQQISANEIRISSVLYGLKRFEIAENVLALVMNYARPNAPAIEVTLLDGSVFVGKGAAFGDGELILSEPALGQLRLPTSAIREVLVLQPFATSRRTTS